MNLKVYGENQTLWQWDTGQQLIVEDADMCQEVHFGREGDDRCPVLQIREENGLRIVDIPNIYLQVAGMFTAFLYGYDENEAQTLCAVRFYVHARPKPDSYVYTETEVRNYSNLAKRIAEIENNGVSEERVATAVQKYLDENPIHTGVQFETDATLTLKDGVLSVNTTDQMEQDNTLPITSAGVYATVGNIEVLLKTI